MRGKALSSCSLSRALRSAPAASEKSCPPLTTSPVPAALPQNTGVDPRTGESCAGERGGPAPGSGAQSWGQVMRCPVPEECRLSELQAVGSSVNQEYLRPPDAFLDFNKVLNKEKNVMN